MAWNGNDSIVREQLRLKLAELRSVSYNHIKEFREMAETVQHPEKGPFLVQACDDLNNYIDALEKRLER